MVSYLYIRFSMPYTDLQSHLGKSIMPYPDLSPVHCRSFVAHTIITCMNFVSGNPMVITTHMRILSYCTLMLIYLSGLVMSRSLTIYMVVLIWSIAAHFVYLCASYDQFLPIHMVVLIWPAPTNTYIWLCSIICFYPYMYMTMFMWSTPVPCK